MTAKRRVVVAVRVSVAVVLLHPPLLQYIYAPAHIIIRITTPAIPPPADPPAVDPSKKMFTQRIKELKSSIKTPNEVDEVNELNLNKITPLSLLELSLYYSAIMQTKKSGIVYT